MKTAAKKLLMTLAGLFMIALYVSLSMKADIGISAYDALARTAGLVSGMRMGTASILFNTLLVIGQAVILGRRTRPKLLLQFIIIFGFGLLVNLIYYELFASWELSGYGWRVLVLFAALELKALGVLTLFRADFVCCPIDGFSMELSRKLGVKYEGVRQAAEGVSLALICAITLLCGCRWTIREGTIVDAALIGPLLWLNKRLFHKLGLSGRGGASAQAM